ncbi:hypothetical protein BGY98DRAFT_1098170 [Russula aff. rugulosa BPL654]|nr:hypothetical protein BGY98DRAFT_1098170 [Russula aff. rugulosa BPL654]
MLMPIGRPVPALPTDLHKILELLPMHRVSLSQSHNTASVLVLEFEHQVMRWFGHIDDADERWKTDVEKVER